MKVYELSRKLGTDNKTLITFFKDNEFKVASHNQNLTDEQVTFAKKNTSLVLFLLSVSFF